MTLGLLTILLLAAVAYSSFVVVKVISQRHRELKGALANVQAEILKLRKALEQIGEDVERLALSPAEIRKRFFEKLPGLLSDRFADMEPGTKLRLWMSIGDDIAPVTYIHRELVYRSSNQRDAVAFGEAALDDSAALSEARILFSRLGEWATMRGLDSDGEVKPRPLGY